MSRPPKLLLHCCCAPCATHPARLLRESYDLTLFFFNPNIHPESEYRDREREMTSLAGRWRIPIITGDYPVDAWFRMTAGHEDDPEGGPRCAICFRMRLLETARQAKKNGCTHFTTTLSISPLKNANLINQIGNEIARQEGLTFLEANFKKKDGFKISCQISREENLYRQDYCGCVYSRQDRLKK